MVLKGKLFEVGDLEGATGRGIRMESNGETIEITGLTQDECREAAQSFGDVLTVTIEPSNEKLRGAAKD